MAVDYSNNIYFSDYDAHVVYRMYVTGSDVSPQPSQAPTSSTPTSIPSSSKPTSQPTGKPSRQPSAQPTRQPSSQPTGRPILRPTSSPSSSKPSSSHPTPNPTPRPSTKPTLSPTPIPTIEAGMPTPDPTPAPSQQPATSAPSSLPTSPSAQPTNQPSRQPSNQPSRQPSSRPSRQPTGQPTGQPTMVPTLQEKIFHFPNISNTDDGTITPGACAPYNQDQSKCNMRNAINFCASERQVSDCRIQLDPTKTYTISSPIAISIGQAKNQGGGASTRKLFKMSSSWVEPIHFDLEAVGQSGGKPIQVTLNGNGATVQGSANSRYLFVTGQPRSAKSVFKLTVNGFNFNGFGSIDKPGGAMYMQGVDVLILNNNTFTNCTASYGGAVYVSGNGTVDKRNAYTKINNCSFSNNTAGYGGRYNMP